ncbi:Alpha/Beta hydrolase protein [Aspergillus cavernicola]|uniref:Alpha/Beta hydrolase protein n=1 Tax=Aspergillus cavernicola TaxID=176166 RepID=A0ABR4ITD0_9EURO
MKLSTTISLLVTAFPLTNTQSTGGSGPYPATYFADPTLQTHTIYMPTNPTPSTPLPILIWGNGACVNNGTRFANLLTNIASYGFIAIASGPPADGTGTTDSQMMRDAITWITTKSLTPTTNNSNTDSNSKYTTVDPTRIAVAGQSCGGLEAYQLRNDERVLHLGIFNSGFFDFSFLPGFESPEVIAEVDKPVFYFLGGESDIAYENGMRDYAALRNVPKWVGNYPVGHLGTYAEVDGGVFGAAAVKWLQWVLKGDQDAAGFFLDGGAEKAGWEETDSEGLEGLV